MQLPTLNWFSWTFFMYCVNLVVCHYRNRIEIYIWIQIAHIQRSAECSYLCVTDWNYLVVVHYPSLNHTNFSCYYSCCCLQCHYIITVLYCIKIHPFSYFIPLFFVLSLFVCYYVCLKMCYDILPSVKMVSFRGVPVLHSSAHIQMMEIIFLAWKRRTFKGG